LKITNKEYKALKEEIWERGADLFQINEENLSKALLEELLEERGKKDAIEVHFRLNLIGNDLRQILSRIRRKK